MKIRIIALLLVLFTSGCIIAIKKKNVTGDNILPIELSVVTINNKKIDSLIVVVINDNHNYLKNKDCFLLMEKIKGDNDSDFVNIVIYEKEKFTITCPNNDYPILGYFEVKNQTILVIGNLLFDEMRILDGKKTFFLKCKRTWKEGITPPPPSLYNPPFYTFPLLN